MKQKPLVFIQAWAVARVTAAEPVVTDRYGGTPVPVFSLDDHGMAPLPSPWACYDCRSNRLLLKLLRDIQPCLQGCDPARIGVILGTSSSGIAAGEKAMTHYHRNGFMPADYHYKQQDLGGMAEFAAVCLGVKGPCYVISSSCASSAQALASARRLLQLGLCDVVVAGGGGGPFSHHGAGIFGPRCFEPDHLQALQPAS